MKKISLFICSFFLCFMLLSCDDTTHRTTDPSLNDSTLTDTTSADTNDVKVSVRCLGFTKSGERCKRMTPNKCGYCYQHVAQSPTPCD